MLLDNSFEERNILVEICRRIADKGFVTATDGNVSTRLPSGIILATPTSINKGFVTAADLVEVNLDGVQLSGSRMPSSEMDMHLFIYRNRPDVNAVVHCHPPYATGFAAARVPLNECLFPEVIVNLGAIPLAPYATPSTPEVGDSIAPFVNNADAILLSNHGVVTYGKDLWDAYFKMEKVEHAAHIVFVARMLGGAKPLSAEQVEKLRSISVESYGKDFSGKIACKLEHGAAGDNDAGTFALSQEEYTLIVEEVKKRLSRHSEKVKQ
ncbi:MAG: class II aldolase/adducin family protein [Bacteroidota bacterium]|nr:class II aldolase/adducin family protein [Bacteroidota bacterium]